MPQPTAYLVTINRYNQDSTSFISTYNIDKLENQVIAIMEETRQAYRRDHTASQLIIKARHLADSQGFSGYIFDRQTNQWVTSVLIKQLPVNPSAGHYSLIDIYIGLLQSAFRYIYHSTTHMLSIHYLPIITPI